MSDVKRYLYADDAEAKIKAAVESLRGSSDDVKEKIVDAIYKNAHDQGYEATAAHRHLTDKSGKYLGKSRPGSASIGMQYFIPYISAITSYKTLDDLIGAIAGASTKSGAKQDWYNAPQSDIISQRQRQRTTGANASVNIVRDGSEYRVNQYPRSEGSKRYYRDAVYLRELENGLHDLDADIQGGDMARARQDDNDIITGLGLRNEGRSFGPSSLVSRTGGRQRAIRFLRALYGDMY
jgi:hypothetical protein